MGEYPPRLCHTPFTRIWPHEELCRFSALVDNPWKWCASCWRKIAISLIDPVSGPRPATSQLHRDLYPAHPPHTSASSSMKSASHHLSISSAPAPPCAAPASAQNQHSAASASMKSASQQQQHSSSISISSAEASDQR